MELKNETRYFTDILDSNSWFLARAMIAIARNIFITNKDWRQKTPITVMVQYFGPIDPVDKE